MNYDVLEAVWSKMCSIHCRSSGLFEFRVWDLFRVSGLGFRVYGSVRA